VRECLQWFTREKQWINDIHLQLCRVPAPTFLEQERAEWFVAQFKSLGWDASIDRAGNVIAPDGRCRALRGAHRAPRYGARPAQLRKTSRWSPTAVFAVPAVSDNGAGLAALLAIARALEGRSALEELALGLLLVANVGEEGEGNLLGMRHLCKQSPLARRSRPFWWLDGANTDHITNRALGSRRFEVAFSGPGGHSWSDYGVGNPVHALCRAVALFADDAHRRHAQIGHQCGLDRRRLQRQRHRATGARQGGYPLGKQREDGRTGGLLTAAVERAREIENQRATGGKVAPS
jgi:tripeptide aminopeptidase